MPKFNPGYVKNRVGNDKIIKILWKTTRYHQEINPRRKLQTIFKIIALLSCKQGISAGNGAGKFKFPALDFLVHKIRAIISKKFIYTLVLFMHYRYNNSSINKIHLYHISFCINRQ